MIITLVLSNGVHVIEKEDCIYNITVYLYISDISLFRRVIARHTHIILLPQQPTPNSRCISIL